jgi:hypothetical protein
MTTIPFRLVLKRSQSPQARGTPIFQVTALAEMTAEFEQAVEKYGLWQEVIWNDPLLEGEADAKLQTAVERDGRRKRRKMGTLAWLEGRSPVTLLFLLPYWILYQAIKLAIMIPIWIFRLSSNVAASNKTQDQRIMRFHELKSGKTLSAPSLVDALAIESAIEEASTSVAQYVKVALNYSGDLVVTDRVA